MERELIRRFRIERVSSRTKEIIWRERWKISQSGRTQKDRAERENDGEICIRI